VINRARSGRVDEARAFNLAVGSVAVDIASGEIGRGVSIRPAGSAGIPRIKGDDDEAHRRHAFAGELAGHGPTKVREREVDPGLLFGDVLDVRRREHRDEQPSQRSANVDHHQPVQQWVVDVDVEGSLQRVGDGPAQLGFTAIESGDGLSPFKGGTQEGVDDDLTRAFASQREFRAERATTTTPARAELSVEERSCSFHVACGLLREPS
jgi:hypothetical protein